MRTPPLLVSSGAAVAGPQQQGVLAAGMAITALNPGMGKMKSRQGFGLMAVLGAVYPGQLLGKGGAGWLRTMGTEAQLLLLLGRRGTNTTVAGSSFYHPVCV